MTFPAEIDELGKGGEGPHAVWRRQLQRDLAGGIDDERRQRGVRIILDWLRFPRSEGGAPGGQANRPRLARSVDDLGETKPNKRSAELECNHIAKRRGAGLVFVDARSRLTSQSRRCRRERRTEEPRVARRKTQRQALQRYPSCGDHSHLRVSQCGQQTGSHPAPVRTPNVDDARRLTFDPARQPQPAIAKPYRLRAERAPTPGPGIWSGDDPPRSRILVDRQHPFCLGERLQQLDVANGWPILAAEPETRRRRPQEPARRRLRYFPH